MTVMTYAVNVAAVVSEKSPQSILATYECFMSPQTCHIFSM